MNDNNSDIWISSNEACNLLGIKKDTLRRSKYKLKKEKIKGSTEYFVLLSSLPVNIQELFFAKPPVNDKNLELEIEIYNKAPKWAKEKANKYLAIFNQTDNLSGKELRNFVVCWNAENPEYKTSYSRILGERKKYDELGIVGLLAKYGNNSGKTKIKNEWYGYFKSMYLKEGAPSLNSCCLYTYGFAIQSEDIPLNKFPSYSSFKYRLDRDMPESAIHLARYGHAKWNRKYASYIDRDYSLLDCGTLWCSDHAQIDVGVLGSNGKMICPTVTVWRDFKSSKWLSWSLHEEPGNSDHIFQTFHYSALEYGIPEDIYIDNGKDYRAKDFAGGRKVVNQNQARYMLGLLKVKVHFAIPYNAQAKPIERDFLKIKQYFSKHTVGYRGGNVVERPEKLKDEIKQEKILTFAEFKTLFDDFITNVLNKMPSKGKVLKGKSPDKLWNLEFKVKRMVSKDALNLFCTRTSKVVSIGRNGVRDSELGVTYWEEWMSAHKGEKVYIRRDIKAFQEAWVFNASTDEYLGRATISELVPVLAETDIQKEELKKAMARKKRDKKITENFIKVEHYSAEENLNNFKAAVNKIAGDVEKSDVKISKIANTFMDKVIAEDKQKQNADNYEVSKLYNSKKVQKKKIYHLKCEIEEEDLCKHLMSS